jgi:hypothetical protein
MKKYIICALVLLSGLLVLAGCSKNDESKKVELETAHGSNNELSYTADESWVKEEPRTSMRKAQYKLPGKDGSGDAELAVFVFPGGGGGVQANINRWLGQFKQPDDKNTLEVAKISEKTSHGLPVTIIYVTGTFMSGAMGGPMAGASEEQPGYAMIAAIVETSSDPWFFKAVGPQATIDYWRSSFESFTTTFNQ